MFGDECGVGVDFSSFASGESAGFVVASDVCVVGGEFGDGLGDGFSGDVVDEVSEVGAVCVGGFFVLGVGVFLDVFEWGLGVVEFEEVGFGDVDGVCEVFDAWHPVEHTDAVVGEGDSNFWHTFGLGCRGCKGVVFCGWLVLGEVFVVDSVGFSVVAGEGCVGFVFAVDGEADLSCEVGGELAGSMGWGVWVVFDEVDVDGCAVIFWVEPDTAAVDIEFEGVVSWVELAAVFDCLFVFGELVFEGLDVGFGWVHCV